MQRVRSSLSNDSRVASRCPSAALTEKKHVATLPVQLPGNDPVARQDNDHVKGYQIKMDAHGFTPEELVVRVDGQSLIVTGHRQEECCDPVRGSYRMKQKVHQQMLLPPDLDPTAMTCSLTPSGKLWVQGQCRVLPPPKTQTGPSSRLPSHGSKKDST
ncbi:heat shock protein beta-9 [Ctenodactylus gundi]